MFDRWDLHYKIQRSVDFEEFIVKFLVIRLHDNVIIGAYRDFRYAKKQAKFRFKKMQKKVEKLLLTSR